MNCIECQEEIQKGARKCKVCNSFQDWRRFFDVGSMVLSLMVALVSVTALSAEKIYSLITGNDSNLLVSGLVTSNGQINLIALNEGGQASAIMYAELEVEDPRAGVAQYQFKLNSDSFLVEPKKVRQLQLISEGNLNKMHTAWLNENSNDDWRNQKIPFLAKCTFTVSTITNAGMEADSRNASNSQIMGLIPFGIPSNKMKEFYFKIDCSKIFDIPMSYGQARLETADENAKGN